MQTRGGAVFSADSVYRYSLWRRWDDGDEMVWIMLNPSTADASLDDPTIRRCIGFAKQYGFGAITVINLYALRATKPKELETHSNPEGPDNLKIWDQVLAGSKKPTVVAAWGGSHPRDAVSMALNRHLHSPSYWWCLGHTKQGDPRHPLYVRRDTEMVRYDY